MVLSHQRGGPAGTFQAPILVPVDMTTVLRSPRHSVHFLRQTLLQDVKDGPSLGLGTEFSPWWDGTLSFPPPIPNLLPKQDQKCTWSSVSVAVWECCLFPGPPGSSVLTTWWGLPERKQPQIPDGLAQLPGENFVASLTTSLKDDVFCLLESHRVWPKPGSFESLIFISSGLMCLTGVRQVQWDPTPVQLTQWGAGCLPSLCLLPDSPPLFAVVRTTPFIPISP